MYGMPSFDRMESPGHVIHLVARLLQRSLWSRVTAHGVAPAQLSILLALYEADALTQTDLVDQVKIDQSTMAKTLSRMERDELIARRPDPDDGRRTQILLTRHARRLESDLKTRATEVNKIARAGVDATDAATCMAVLHRMVDNLDADIAGPTPGD